MADKLDARLLEALPERPLSRDEGAALEAQESASTYVRPESIVLLEDEEVVVAIQAVSRERGYSWLLGYEPDVGGWRVVESWSADELEHDVFYETLERWETEAFG